jgi:branched-chain amino acid aminotransferase
MTFNINDSKVWLKEDFVSYRDATVSVVNKAFMYGLYVFTGIRGNWNSEKQKLYLFRLQDHYKRFVNSCKIMRFKNFEKLYSQERFTEKITEIIKINNIKQDIYIRPFSFVDEDKMAPALGTDSFGIVLYDIAQYVKDTGLKCKVSSYTRVEDNMISPRIKVGGAYVNSALVKHEALSLGFDEGIVLDRDGHAVEGSTENLFIVRDGTIITPQQSNNILEGINAKSVIELAKEEGFEVVERPIDRTELFVADEVFLTGTAARIAIVSQVDDLPVGNGHYPVSQKLQGVFNDIAYGRSSVYPEWVIEV